MHAYACPDADAHVNTRRLIFLHNFGSCSLFSSSACRRLVVVVREEMHILNLGFSLNVNLSHLNVVAPRNAIGVFNLLR